MLWGMGHGLGWGNGNNQQETNQETFWIWNEQKVWLYWEVVMKEGSGMIFRFLVYLNW